MTNSRLAGFYNQSLEERLSRAAAAAGLTPEELTAWKDGGLSLESADHMIENAIGLHALPLGLGLNFQINGRDCVPWPI